MHYFLRPTIEWVKNLLENKCFFFKIFITLLRNLHTQSLLFTLTIIILSTKFYHSLWPSFLFICCSVPILITVLWHSFPPSAIYFRHCFSIHKSINYFPLHFISISSHNIYPFICFICLSIFYVYFPFIYRSIRSRCLSISLSFLSTILITNYSLRIFL